MIGCLPGVETSDRLISLSALGVVPSNQDPDLLNVNALGTHAVYTQ